MNNQSIDRFGEIVIRGMRDNTIREWDMIIDGDMKDHISKGIYEKLSIFTQEQIDILLWIIPKIVDTTIHNLLWTVEQEKSIDLIYYSEKNGPESIKDISDGLSCEQYGQEGWIARYSHQRHEETC